MASTTVASLLFVALGGGAGIRDAAAETDVPSARLRVDANPACTTRADVVARVQARSPRVEFDEESGEIRIRAQFSVAQSGAVDGQVLLAAPGARPSLRRVVAASCGEAADAVALIIAVTLDPTAAERGKNTTATEAASADARPPASEPAQPQLDRNDADRSSGDGPSPTASNVGGRQTFGVQLAGQSFFGPAPAVMPGLALYVMVGVDRTTLWSPAVLLSATHAWRTDIGAEGGTAAFTLDAASFDACPFRLRLGRVDARPCASALVGRFSAEGHETRNAGQSSRPFWVIGGAAVVSAELPWLFEVSARLAVGANLVRDSFEFTPVVFHQVPAITTAASLGVGLRWR